MWGGDTEGNYLDTSFTDAKAVVTPAFAPGRGIYYITVSYRGKGIIKAGFLYDQPRNGVELVENDEYYMDPEENTLSYRFKLRDDSPVRYKIRLTGDAGDGDYVQLLDVRIAPSRLSYVYPVFICAALLLLFDALLVFYDKVYRKWPKERRVVSLILLLAALYSSLPLFQNGLSATGDLIFHLHRIEGVYQGLLAGQFPVRIQPGWMDGNGYAVSVFYGDVLLYFPAILRMVGFTVQDAYKIFVIGCHIATAAAAYFSFRKITKNDVAAATGAILYLCSARRIYSVYTNTAAGTYSGMIFYPLIVAAFWQLYTEDVGSKAYKRLWLPLAAGFGGLLITHTLGCLVVGSVSLVLCLLMIRRTLRKETLRELCKAVLAAVLLHLWYLVPLIQYMATEKIHINRNLAEEAAAGDYYALLAKFAATGKNGYEFIMDQGAVGCSLALVIVLYIITIPWHPKTPYTRAARVLFGYTLCVLWTCSAYFPVTGIAQKSGIAYKFFETIQSQDRILSVVVALLACLGAVLLSLDLFGHKTTYIFAGILCGIALYQNLQYFETVETDTVYLEEADVNARMGKHPYDYGLGNAEYLPVAASTYNITKETVSSETLTVTANDRRYLTYDTTVINNADAEGHIVYPILYYSGYRAVDRTDGTVLKTAAGDNGQVDVTVPAGYAGTFRMAFHEPWYWRAAELVSLAALIWGFYDFFIKNKRQKGVSYGDQKNYRSCVPQVRQSRAGD